MFISTLLLLIQLSRATPIQPDAQLAQAAEVRAEQIYKDGYSNVNWKDSFKGTNCFYYGENVIKGNASAEVSQGTMMNLHMYRNNILDPNFKTIGIGQFNDVTTILFCGEVPYYKLVK